MAYTLYKMFACAKYKTLNKNLSFSLREGWETLTHPALHICLFNKILVNVGFVFYVHFSHLQKLTARD